MKTAFIYRITISLFCLGIFIGTSGQQNFRQASGEPYAQESHARHVETLSQLISSQKANHNILKHLTKNSIDEKKIQWDLLGQNISAHFKSKNTNTKMLFNKNGRLIYSIDYLTGENLPQEIRKKVMEDYWHYDISCAARVKEAGTLVYIINLEGKRDYINVVVEDGKIGEIAHYKKSE